MIDGSSLRTEDIHGASSAAGEKRIRFGDGSSDMIAD